MSLLVACLAGSVAAATLAGSGGPRRRLRLRPVPGTRRAAVVAGMMVVVATWRLAGGSPVPLVVAVLVAAVMAAALRARAAARRRAAIGIDTVAMCLSVAAELRAGRPAGDALGTVASQLGPLCAGVRSAARAVGRGARVEDELDALARDTGSPRLETVAAVWAAVAGTGAGIADVLDRVGRAFAADDEAQAELGALAAGPRASALVLCALPLLALCLGVAAGADPVAVLTRSSFGWLLTGLAAVLDVTGLLWVRTITSRALAG
jgi:tight adherence protein B